MIPSDVKRRAGAVGSAVAAPNWPRNCDALYVPSAVKVPLRRQRRLSRLLDLDEASCAVECRSQKKLDGLSPAKAATADAFSNTSFRTRF